MAIIEFIGGRITHRYLMNKRKDDLARMILDALEREDKQREAFTQKHWPSNHIVVSFGPDANPEAVAAIRTVLEAEQNTNYATGYLQAIAKHTDSGKRYAAVLGRHGGMSFEDDARVCSPLQDQKLVLVPEGQSLTMDDGLAARPWLHPYLDGWFLIGFVEIVPALKQESN